MILLLLCLLIMTCDVLHNLKCDCVRTVIVIVYVRLLCLFTYSCCVHTVMVLVYVELFSSTVFVVHVEVLKR